MKPLIMTSRSLREFAGGMTPDLLPTSTKMQLIHCEGADYIVHRDDTEESQRVYFDRADTGTDLFLPASLRALRRDSAGRLASFAERAGNGPVSLPKGWGQYKVDTFVAFAALPISRGSSIRWITEVATQSPNDTYIWRTTSNDSKATLQAYMEEHPSRARIDQHEWANAHTDAKKLFERADLAARADVDMTLSPLATTDDFGWTYDTWINKVSNEQLNFIESSTDRSIRLRGPAGSGKTLALTLKALREIKARVSEEEARVLFITHSWALASQVERSINAMGEQSQALDVFPLVAVAQDLLPVEYAGLGTSLIGDDSLSGKQAQLDEIEDLIDQFVLSDWVSYRDGVSPSLARRFDSSDKDVRLALAWDLLIEFGSVIGALNIFPGAGADLRYYRTTRAPWMLPLPSNADKRVVFELYSRYLESLDQRGLMTADQLLSDFVSYLESHAWNRRRRESGYDLIFVDEFHLFNPLERQVLQHLNRDTRSYPRLFMAADPTQSPSAQLIGAAAAATQSDDDALANTNPGEISNFDLQEVHRFTPQILDLIRHVQASFPTLSYGHEWDIDFSKVESLAAQGPQPILVRSESREAETLDLYEQVRKHHSAGTVGVAVVDSRQWSRFTDFAANLSHSGKFGVSVLSGRGDINTLSYRNRGVVIGSAEHLAGLQFETIIVTGIPDMRSDYISSAERTRLLSLLYLAVSRAEKHVAVLVNDEDGGAPDLLTQAVRKGILGSESGSSVMH